MPIKLTAKNEASRDRTINKVNIQVLQAAYTGFMGEVIDEKLFDGPITLKAGEGIVHK